MAKGYWIAHISVRDPDGYKKYVAADTPVIAAWGGRFIVRGDQHEAPEGEARDRHVVIEFSSYETALACYRSPEYQEAAAHRKASADSEIIIVEGHEGDTG